MATTTPNFGWAVPTSTDLVKDGAVAIETLGDAIDASLVDLKGGTTGQVLKKASGTDMDFTWSADSAGMTNPMTTTGDTIYSSSGSTPARLGIGSTGQVLTVASGVPSWATPAAGGSTFVGASVYKSAAQSTSANTETILTFPNENFDTDGFHDNSTNNGRFTIPTGKDGKYLLVANVNWDGNSTGNRQAYFVKNNTTTMVMLEVVNSGTRGLGYCLTTIVNLVAGDYIDIRVWQNSGTTVTVISDNPTNYMIQYLGA